MEASSGRSNVVGKMDLHSRFVSTFLSNVHCELESSSSACPIGPVSRVQCPDPVLSQHSLICLKHQSDGQSPSRTRKNFTDIARTCLRLKHEELYALS